MQPAERITEILDHREQIFDQIQTDIKNAINALDNLQSELTKGTNRN